MSNFIIAKDINMPGSFEHFRPIFMVAAGEVYSDLPEDARGFETMDEAIQAARHLPAHYVCTYDDKHIRRETRDTMEGITAMTRKAKKPGTRTKKCLEPGVYAKTLTFSVPASIYKEVHAEADALGIGLSKLFLKLWAERSGHALPKGLAS